MACTHLEVHLAEAGAGNGYWQPIERVFGEFASWPSTWRELARGMVLTALGEVKRRLADTFDRPPYNFLVPLVSPASSPAVRRKSADAFMGVWDAQLDACSRKIRTWAGSQGCPAVDFLLSPLCQDFLFNALNKIPVSSAIVECLFAAFNAWLLPMGRRPHLSLI